LEITSKKYKIIFDQKYSEFHYEARVKYGILRFQVRHPFKEPITNLGQSNEIASTLFFHMCNLLQSHAWSTQYRISLILTLMSCNRSWQHRGTTSQGNSENCFTGKILSYY